MPRKKSVPQPTRYPAILFRLVEATSQGKEYTISEIDGTPMTWKQALAFKQQLVCFRATLQEAVADGQDYAKTFADALSTRTRIQTLPPQKNAPTVKCYHCKGLGIAWSRVLRKETTCTRCNGDKTILEPSGSITFYSAEHTPFAKTMEQALNEPEVCE